MRVFKNSVYRDTFVPDHCREESLTYWNADNWQEDLIHKAVRINPIDNRRIALDLGGNVGLTTIALKHYFKQVYSFEADPLNYECLLKNVSFLKNVHCFNAAVYDASGKEVILQRSKDGVIGHTRIVNPYDTNEVKRFDINEGECFTSNTLALDDMAEVFKDKIDFVKLDIESSELFAFRGMQQIIKQNQPTILVEIPKLLAKDFDLYYTWLRVRNYIFVDKLARDFLFVHESKQDRLQEYLNLSKHDKLFSRVRYK